MTPQLDNKVKASISILEHNNTTSTGFTQSGAFKKNRPNLKLTLTDPSVGITKKMPVPTQSGLSIVNEEIGICDEKQKGNIAVAAFPSLGKFISLQPLIESEVKSSVSSERES